MHWSCKVRKTKGVQEAWGAENTIWHTGVRKKEQRAGLGDAIKEALVNLVNERLWDSSIFFFLGFPWSEAGEAGNAGLSSAESLHFVHFSSWLVKAFSTSGSLCNYILIC